MEKKKVEVEEIAAKTWINDEGFLCRSKTQQKCDSHFDEQYIEIPPLAVDEVTGEVLNKTLVPILKRVEDKNFYEEIQSYKDDCDIYSILAKFEKTGDISLLHQGIKEFGDYYDIPDNINDFENLVKKSKEEIKKYAESQQKTIIDGNDEQVNKLVEDIVKAQLIKQGFVKQDESEVKE